MKRRAPGSLLVYRDSKTHHYRFYRVNVNKESVFKCYVERIGSVGWAAFGPVSGFLGRPLLGTFLTLKEAKQWARIKYKCDGCR